MTESVTPTVLYEERGAVALITFNRPTALNSFTRQMHQIPTQYSYPDNLFYHVSIG